MALELRELGETRLLTARGTLYKALDRMERAGWLSSRWENAEIAVEDGRPRRRLYVVTAVGEGALAESRAAGASLQNLSVGPRPV